MIHISFFIEQKLREGNSYSQRKDRARGPMLSRGRVCKRKRGRKIKEIHREKKKGYSIISVTTPAQNIVQTWCLFLSTKGLTSPRKLFVSQSFCYNPQQLPMPQTTFKASSMAKPRWSHQQPSGCSSDALQVLQFLRAHVPAMGAVAQLGCSQSSAGGCCPGSTSPRFQRLSQEQEDRAQGVSEMHVRYLHRKCVWRYKHQHTRAQGCRCREIRSNQALQVCPTMFFKMPLYHMELAFRLQQGIKEGFFLLCQNHVAAFFFFLIKTNT